MNIKELVIKLIELLKAYLEKEESTELEQDGQSSPPDKKTQKFVLAVIVGHERKSPGASMHRSVGVQNEYTYNTDVARQMVIYGNTQNVKVEVIFRDGIGITGANKKAAALKPDACIELHFNAFNSVVSGTETLATADQNDVQFAKIVQKKMCELFERQGFSRGVKIIPRSARGGGNVHGLPSLSNCLVEPFFGDNEAEAKMAILKKDAYAKALVDAAKAYFDSLVDIKAG